MDLSGRRESTNVDDRRSGGGTAMAGMGIGALVIAALLTYFLGGNPLSVLQNMDLTEIGTSQRSSGEGEFTEEEQQFATLAKQVLAGTEDVWTKVFQQYGRQYVAPQMVLFTGAVNTGCGGATSQVGPFYCSADQKLYIDLSFFKQMRDQMGAGGDFAYAYVIGHEVGHHVQNLLGTLGSAHAQMAKTNSTQSNRISVRIELQADFYAGVWAYHDNQMYNSLEDGDIEIAINCAQKIGDDYLQKQAQGYAVPESFTHGTAKQRMKWLKKGLTTGDLSQGNTFRLSDSEL